MGRSVCFTVTYEIADIAFRTESDTVLNCFLHYHFQRFVSGVTDPDVRMIFRMVSDEGMLPQVWVHDEPSGLADCHSLSGRELRGALLGLPSVRRELEGFRQSPDRRVVEFRPHYVSIHDFASNTLTVLYDACMREMLARCRFEPHGFAAFLPSFSAVMIHASAVVRQNGAAVFLASDEGGKTTVARSTESSSVLGDDQVVLRKAARAYRVHGTPWGLLANPSLAGPLGAFFLLEHAERFALSPVMPEVVFAHLWQEHLLDQMILPKPMRSIRFGLLSEIARNVPAYRMRFPRDHVDWAAIDAAMAREKLQGQAQS